MFDSGSMTWKEKMRMHASRAYVALAVHDYGNRMFVAGGENAQKEYVYNEPHLLFPLPRSFPVCREKKRKRRGVKKFYISVIGVRPTYIWTSRVFDC